MGTVYGSAEVNGSLPSSGRIKVTDSINGGQLTVLGAVEQGALIDIHELIGEFGVRVDRAECYAANGLGGRISGTIDGNATGDGDSPLTLTYFPPVKLSWNSA